MTTDVAKSNGKTALMVPDDAENFVVPGMENVQPGELRIPLLKLVQGTSRMAEAAEHGGEWHNSVTGEFSPSPEVLIIGVAKGRVMFPPTFNADNKPLCGSDDGKAPRADYVGTSLKTVGYDADGGPVVSTQIIPKLCADCPFSAWGDDGTPPKCNEVATFAGMVQEGMPVLIQVRSTGMKNVPNLKTLIAANGIRKAIRLGAVQEKNETGVYYVPVFLVGAKPHKEWQAMAIRLARMGNLAARNQQAIIEYEQRQDVGPSDATDQDYEDSGPEAFAPGYEEPEFEMPF